MEKRKTNKNERIKSSLPKQDGDCSNFVSYFREIFKHYLPASTWESRKEQTFVVVFLGSSSVKRIYTLRFGSTLWEKQRLSFPLEQLS
jgi:hypothetical protein